MHILFATPELAPFTPDSPLALSCASLAAALRAYDPASRFTVGERATTNLRTLRHPITSLAVITPLHGFMDPTELRLARRLSTLSVPFGKGVEDVVVYEGTTDDRVNVFFLQHPALLSDRDHVYGPPNGKPYRDNAQRYAFFARAVIEFCRTFSRITDLIQCWGWGSALVPAYLWTLYENDPALSDIMTLFTVTDPSDQGTFTTRQLGPTHLAPGKTIEADDLVLGKHANFTLAGVAHADMTLLNSRALARDLQNPKGPYGLHEVFRDRREDLASIVFGTDQDAWDPSSDDLLPVTFSHERLNGKRLNKAELQHIFGLPVRPMLPIVGLVDGLDDPDAVALAAEALDTLLEDGVGLQCIALGQPGGDFAQALVDLAKRHPRSVSLHLRDDDALFHRTIAGVDIVLGLRKHPSRALATLRAMAYGAVPVAFRGGIHPDLIADWKGDDDTELGGRGAGVLFPYYDGDGLADAIEDAIELYRQPRQWRPMINACMQADFSWRASATRYIDLYHDLLEAE